MTNETEAPDVGIVEQMNANSLFENHIHLKARIAELEAELDELTERVDELQHACEVISSEFEGELWQSCRRLLQKTGFDFHGSDVDGIQADAFESHMNETLAEFDRTVGRVEAAEAKLAKADALAAECERAFDDVDGTGTQEFYLALYTYTDSRATLEELQKPIATRDDPA